MVPSCWGHLFGLNMSRNECCASWLLMLRCASKQKTSVELVSFLASVSTCIICIHEKWNHHYRSFIFAMTLQWAGRSVCGILLGHIIMYKQYQLFLLKCNNTRSVSLSKYQYITHTQKQENVFALSRYTSLCTSRLIRWKISLWVPLQNHIWRRDCGSLCRITFGGGTVAITSQESTSHTLCSQYIVLVASALKSKKGASHSRWYPPV